jgi:hypothetical protein
MALTATTGVLAFLMFYTTLRRYAVGTRGPLLLLDPSWTPPGTVFGVVLLYLIGAALAALVVLKSWAPYPVAVTVGEGGVPAAGIEAVPAEDVSVPDLAVVTAPAQATANGNGNGRTHHANGAGKAGAVTGAATAIVAASATDDRGPAVASAS